MAEEIWDIVKLVPPITRTFVAAVSVLSLCCQLEFVSPYDLYFHWPLVYKDFQVWRLITCHLFHPLGLGFFFNMAMLIQFAGALERDTFRRRPADYLFMWIVGAAFLLVVPPLFNYSLFFTCDPLINMAIYVWSKHNPDAPVRLNGAFVVPAVWMPFACMGLSWLWGGAPLYDLFGILAGHVWYFFTVLYPRASGRYLLKTPEFLIALLASFGLRQLPGPQLQQQWQQQRQQQQQQQQHFQPGEESEDEEEEEDDGEEGEGQQQGEGRHED